LRRDARDGPGSGPVSSETGSSAAQRRRAARWGEVSGSGVVRLRRRARGVYPGIQSGAAGPAEDSHPETASFLARRGDRSTPSGVARPPGRVVRTRRRRPYELPPAREPSPNASPRLLPVQRRLEAPGRQSVTPVRPLPDPDITARAARRGTRGAPVLSGLFRRSGGFPRVSGRAASAYAPRWRRPARARKGGRPGHDLVRAGASQRDRRGLPASTPKSDYLCDITRKSRGTYQRWSGVQSC
jgi:hypothetical protein